MMMAALYSNPNWDSEKADRSARIKELDKHYNRAIELVYDPDLEEEGEPDWDNPFWQGHVRSLSKTRVKWGLDEPDESDTVGEYITPEQRAMLVERVQSRARRDEMRRSVDQLVTVN